MRKIKRTYKKIRCVFHRYINGTRGVISIFLALLMSPLLSISLLLVESARYQDAIQLMDEVIDSSAFSTLADYDSYLDERFGLLSVSQEKKISSNFADYLNANVKALGNSVTVNSRSASGQFALSNKDILKQQLLEYSEISVLSEVVTEGIDLDELISNLEEKLKLDKITEEVEAVTSGIDLAAEVEKLIEGITDAKKQYTDKYSPALTSYKNAYTDFESKGDALITALKNATNNLEEDEDVSAIYDDGKVKKAISNLKKSRDSYKSAASTLKTEYSTLKGYIETVMSAADSLPSKLQDFDDKNAESSLAADCTTSTYEWIKIITDQLTTSLSVTVGDNFSDDADSDIQKLANQVTKLGNVGDKTITSSWDKTKIQKEYGTISITTITSTFITEMTEIVTALNSHANINSDSSVQMTGLLEIVKDLLGISGLYDANLNAALEPSCLYSSTKMSVTAKMSVSSMTDLVDACETFTDSISSLNIIKAVKALVKLLKAVATFLAAIVAWATEAIVNLVLYVAGGPKEWYNGLLLYGYGAYNFPNRTNYNSGNTVSGYSYSEIYKMAGGTKTSPSILGSLKELKNFKNATGTNKLFKGAEAEYILVGSTSEIQNQCVAFFDLYLLRLLLDIWPVFKNKEVTAISALAGPGAWVVKLAIALAEPMLDTIILVNGGKEYIFKETVYISYSGFVVLQNDLVGITAISGNLQNKIKDTIKAKNGTPSEKGLCDASYTEHMLLLMFLCVKEDTYLNRVRNLIQMEAAEKHKDEFTFKLNKAYTYMYSDVSYTLNPMFKIDSLTKNGLFTKSIKQYAGY